MQPGSAGAVPAASSGELHSKKKGDVRPTSPGQRLQENYFSVLQEPWHPPHPSLALKLMLELMRNPYPMKSTVNGLAFS
jgi:hypothetical protein